MADVMGTADSYDLTVGQKISIDEAIYMLSPMDAPLLTGVDSDGLSVLGSMPVTEVEHTWMDEEILTPRSVLAANLTAGTTFLTVASADRIKFTTGDLIHIRTPAGGDESVLVTGYGVTTAGTILVTRGVIGSAAAHATGITIMSVGTALAEGSSPENGRYRDRNTAKNCTQIFGPYKVSMTGTQRVISRYGVPDQFAHEVWKLTKQVGITREQALVYGGYYNSTDAAKRTHGGIDYYITTNVQSTSTELNVVNIQGIQASMFDYGGIADRLMTNPRTLEDLDDTTNTSHIRTTMAESGRGRMPVAYIDTEFGRLTVVRNRWVVKTDAFLFNREQAVVRTLRPLVIEPLAKTGDADHVQMVGEYSLTFKGEEHAAKFDNLTAY